jgi:hypothetical protein
MIDIVIPTMWYVEGFDKSLETYVNHDSINKIIIIDNNKSKRPNYDILKHNKVEIVSYGRNIFVNPAWNEGYYRAKSEILGILNDDIKVSSEVFDVVINFGLKSGDLIGVNLQGRQNNYKIDDYIDTKEEIVKLNYDRTKPIGGQSWAFGICMFMLRESYCVIPSLYQVWYGDDYFAQGAKNVYAINSNKIKGTISETLTKFNDPDSDISKRIELDSKNLIAYDHFINGKNWDIPRNMIKMYADQRKSSNDDFFEIEYQRAKKTPSDINENIHILYELAKECDTVVEMGVRTGVSTRAFLNTSVKLLSFDTVLHPEVSKLFELAKLKGKNVQYIQADVLDIEIEDTDLLFIDTLHTYDQLKKELELHGNKAKKYIAFHDTYTFGLRGEGKKDNKGLLSAIIEFVITNPHWNFFIHTVNNNGFTVLKRDAQLEII